jgi:multiple sugar transport system substrate-binding protein
MPRVMVEDPKTLEALRQHSSSIYGTTRIDWYEAGQTPARKSLAEMSGVERETASHYAVFRIRIRKTVPDVPAESEI